MKKLLYFTSLGCVPCKNFAPIINQVTQNIPVEKINVDHNKDITSTYGVRAVPTVILVENNQEIRRFSGVKSYNEIIQFING